MLNLSMLEQLTLQDFEPLLGKTFELGHGAEVRPARLVSATAGRANHDDFRAPFSLIIRAEMSQGYWPQGTYRLSHAKLGDLELFMVPIGPDGEGMRYEINFS